MSIKQWAVLAAVLVPGAMFATAPKPDLLLAPPRLELVPVPDDLEQLACQYTARQIAVLEKLNRCDRDVLTTLGEIVVPLSWREDERDYSPLPEDFAWAGNFEKAIVLNQPLQAFGAYEQGRLVRWGPVSSGAEKTPTPTGMFYLNWKAKGHRSTLNRNWFLRWYFNFQNQRGHSFHEYNLPGRPASHGCVRLLGRDAHWIYEWAEDWSLDERGWVVLRPGTPVLILDSYRFDLPAPWREPMFLRSGEVPRPAPILLTERDRELLERAIADDEPPPTDEVEADLE